MMTVPVHVPSVNALGSAETVKLSPSGGMIPFDGATLSHGLSTVLAADTVTFAFTEVRLGIVPAVISVPVLPRVAPRAVHQLFNLHRRGNAAAKAVEHPRRPGGLRARL